MPRTLIGKGDAVVVGLPTGFVLEEVLKKAEKVRLGTAFAHRSGWKHFRQGINEGTASVFLLTGLECCQTEPSLLKDWLQLQSEQPKRIEAKLASPKTFFHPKVLLVTFADQQPDFAIVGSGNLSQGGMDGNTECSVYVQDSGLVKQLTSWFDAEFSRDEAVRLTSRAIEAYEPSYKRNRGRQKKLQEEQRLVQEKVLSVVPAWNWEKALKAAKQYFSSSKFRNKDYPSRKRGAGDILKALKYPNFTFDKQGFEEFFSIGALGWLNPINRDKIFRSAARIRNGLKALVSGSEASLPSVLNKGGKFYVSGFSLNAVTKFLAAYDPKTWPLFNNRVRRVLDDFGYEKPRGFKKAEEYIAYKQAMQKFMDACKEQVEEELDALALDCFFLHRSAQVEAKQKNK
jgi:HKD family nuclease